MEGTFPRILILYEPRAIIGDDQIYNIIVTHFFLFQMLPLLAIAATLLVFLLTILWYRQKKLPPGPWGLPFLGYLPWLDPKAPYQTFTTLAKKYGPVYGVALGNLYTVVLTDPKDIRSVLAKDVVTGRAPLFVTHGIMKGYGKIVL